MAEIVEIKTDETSGRQYYLYDTGMQIWTDSGQIKQPSPATVITTSERGKELIARRYELAQQKALEGIDEAAIEAGKLPTLDRETGDGWKVIVKHVAATLLESKNLRGQAEAANFLGKATGYTTPETDNSENIAAAIARLFEKFLDRLPPHVGQSTDSDQRDMVEGKVIE